MCKTEFQSLKPLLTVMSTQRKIKPMQYKIRMETKVPEESLAEGSLTNASIQLSA